MTFQLDTSGFVATGFVGGKRALETEWADLDPFTQGYIEALMMEVSDGRRWDYNGLRPAFSDLAPETLARIIEDCAAIQTNLATLWPDDAPDKALGSLVWEKRQRGEYRAFPPLTGTLGDDGKVRFA